MDSEAFNSEKTSQSSISQTTETASDAPSGTDAEKAQEILDACRWKDIPKLQSLAESPGGFLTDTLRQEAWPILLGYSNHVSLNKESVDDGESVDLTSSGSDDAASPWRDLAPHRDEDQVQLDVNRAFVYYPNHTSPAELDRQKIELSDLIVEVLRRHPYLCYFQGYHDICQVFLLVLPPTSRASLVARLSALRIRDFMLPSLAPAIAQLRLIPAILRAADPKLWRHLSGTEPFFALSGTLTMYAHDVQSLGGIARLFDALLAREPAFSVYVFARIVLDRRDELFDVPPSEPEVLHSILSKLPQPLDIDRLVADSAELFASHPPESLGAPWSRGISRNSVLKTARTTEACAAQSIVEGRTFFEKHARELEWAERRDKLLAAAWKYRKPARTLGLAIIVGVLAFWLRRSPGPWAYLTALFSRRSGH
ncbi:Rab-GTPase-TBC domain-containing protein [Pleurostoma richardsiae]|uniref:Rab-GTPase-TBC domain-containing protein n=1 Tax=Pleurostoma richardsiae TaxID=41990 RepID=A0AA38VJG9_9PEZI|nr:Rab-GTPase-TBC domain-containing protein [Pleurostoma richardsiae]